ncbi:MAG: hypothetical protein E7260_02115 [Lachnospiraceae bacterium]|nr:hypothetical protein [Lachnospiraceae bacterium]
MKRIVGLAVILLLCTLLGGCLETPPLTDAEMDMVAEYAAGMLLKYDKNYRSPLLEKEEVNLWNEENVTPTPFPTDSAEEQGKNPAPTNAPAEEGTPTPVPTQTAVSPTLTPLFGGSEESNLQLTQVVGVEGFKVSYESYETVQEVVRNEYFYLAAKDGRQYMVLHFMLTNTTGESKVFDASKQKLECSVDINLGTVSRLSISMLENDLQYMPIEVPANSSVPAVLVFEISAKEEIDTAHLIMMNKDNDAVFIKLK